MKMSEPLVSEEDIKKIEYMIKNWDNPVTEIDIKPIEKLYKAYKELQEESYEEYHWYKEEIKEITKLEESDTSDKDIKILENLIKECEECSFFACEACEISCTEVQAIRKLIKRNRELKKENEELSGKVIENICHEAEEEVLQEYKDKIKELEKSVQKYKNMYEAEHRIHEERNRQIADFEKWNNNAKMKISEILEDREKNYIKKLVIEGKIKELEKIEYIDYARIKYAIIILEKLLGGEK
jgi:hypothetical protein